MCVQDIQVIPGTSNPKLCMLSDEYSPSVAVFNCDFDHASCGEVRRVAGGQCAWCLVAGVALLAAAAAMAAMAAAARAGAWNHPPCKTCDSTFLARGGLSPISCLLAWTPVLATSFSDCLQVKVRYVPKVLGGASYFGSFTGYPVKAILPDSFMMRRNNKGLENVAVSPDGKTAWTMMQVGWLRWIGGRVVVQVGLVLGAWAGRWMGRVKLDTWAGTRLGCWLGEWRLEAPRLPSMA